MKFLSAAVLLGSTAVSAFAPPSSSAALRTTTRLNMSQQFDLTKPTFDLYSLRSIRGDALTRYSSLNQSEPLRINIWGLFAVMSFCSPIIAEEVGGEALPLAGVALAVAGGVGTGGLFVRECQRRSRKLTRIEKELDALSLEVRLPNNRLADQEFQPAMPLKQLLNGQTARIVAISGSASQLKESLQGLQVLGRRLTQAKAFVVPVPTDGSSRDDWGLVSDVRQPWLADVGSSEQWRSYFSSLADEDGRVNDSEFKWFGMGASGRSFGSGKGSSPEWLQLLGQHLRPTEILDPSDESQADMHGVLVQQGKFYKALTEGSLEDMKNVCSSDAASQVSAVLAQGGRMDDWAACLAEGARPSGMQLGDADVTVVSDTLAYSTTIEFPVTDYDGLDDANLLAVQTWSRGSNNEDWKLSLHQTIPWSADRRAGGTLLCDCRGCVALTRGPDKRGRWSGMIG